MKALWELGPRPYGILAENTALRRASVSAARVQHALEENETCASARLTRLAVDIEAEVALSAGRLAAVPWEPPHPGYSRVVLKNDPARVFSRARTARCSTRAGHHGDRGPERLREANMSMR